MMAMRSTITAALALAAALAVSATASAQAPSSTAQTTPTAQLDCPLHSPCPTLGAPTAKVISLQLAFDGAMAALNACADIHFGGGSVAVLDNFGVPLVMLRQAGARGVDMEVARRKAYTALKTGMSSEDFGKSLHAGPPGGAAGAGRPAQGAAGARPAAGPRGTGPDPKMDPLKGPVRRGDPDLVTFGGGEPITVDGQVFGAIGVTGVPPKDTPCSKAGEAYIEDKLR